MVSRARARDKGGAYVEVAWGGGSRSGGELQR